MYVPSTVTLYTSVSYSKLAAFGNLLYTIIRTRGLLYYFAHSLFPNTEGSINYVFQSPLSPFNFVFFPMFSTSLSKNNTAMLPTTPLAPASPNSKTTISIPLPLLSRLFKLNARRKDGLLLKLGHPTAELIGNATSTYGLVYDRGRP